MNIELKIGNKTYSESKCTYIMGILNVTPDSFSDGGKYADREDAIVQALRMIDEGASVIDIGGESTRPGYIPVSIDEEIARVVPVIRAIRERSDVAVSIDTYKYDVAKAAIEAGADMLNSIWGFTGVIKPDASPTEQEALKNEGEELAKLVKETGASVCLMHNRGEIWSDEGADKDTDIKKSTDRYLKVVCDELMESVAIAKKYGIEDNRILLDPGVGFGKSYEQNLMVIKAVDRICDLGYPVMMAASKKSVIGNALDLPVDERLEGTIAISVYSAMKGCSFVRVHDVKENLRALKVLHTISKF